MAVRVDDLTTDVTVEGERGGAGGGAESSAPGGGEPIWQRLEMARALSERLHRDAERTRSEAYGD